ncbi:class I SAM-dependent DNA methyltransferase [Paraglaciecola arctica]|uniref:class I SAM-dependent DNA methyltransferase n=1 Tax=Paraglaciecola arctica TaxID=1128911 RepID=UPI001C06E519|nr:class I SAM-dependent methyltransferase [Paraglaciecola arctica]
MSNEWDEYAPSWDQDASVQEYANKAFAELTKVITLDDLSVLDFGCGTGNLALLLSPKVKNILALDASPEMIKRVANKNLDNVSSVAGFLTQELINRHPQFPNKFDLIVASSVCGFLPDYESTLGLLKTVLKRGGVFVQWDWLAKDDSSETGLSENRVTEALKSNGFIDIELEKPFAMTSSKGTMTVLMAVAKKP